MKGCILILHTLLGLGRFGNYKYEIHDKIISAEPPLLGERYIWMEEVMSMLIEWWYGKEKEDKGISDI